ncbi:WPE palindromic element domain-containing protein [Wolbachia endosymbiont of Zygogramma bicolorata]
MSSQCPDYLDPEDLISTKWLHNKGWIPASRAGMTSFLVDSNHNVRTVVGL